MLAFLQAKMYFYLCSKENKSLSPEKAQTALARPHSQNMRRSYSVRHPVRRARSRQAPNRPSHASPLQRRGQKRLLCKYEDRHWLLGAAGWRLGKMKSQRVRHILASEAGLHELAAETRRVRFERYAAQQVGTTIKNTSKCDLRGT